MCVVGVGVATVAVIAVACCRDKLNFRAVFHDVVFFLCQWFVSCIRFCVPRVLVCFTALLISLARSLSIGVLGLQVASFGPGFIARSEASIDGAPVPFHLSLAVFRSSCELLTLRCCRSFHDDAPQTSLPLHCLCLVVSFALCVLFCISVRAWLCAFSHLACVLICLCTPRGVVSPVVTCSVWLAGRLAFISPVLAVVRVALVLPDALPSCHNTLSLRIYSCRVVLFCRLVSWSFPRLSCLVPLETITVYTRVRTCVATLKLGCECCLLVCGDTI
jgi:hypothetical protein